MPDTTLHGYRIDDNAAQPLLFAPVEAPTLFGYPAPVASSHELPSADMVELPTLEQPASPMIERVEPGTPTAPAPAMSVSFESLPPRAPVSAPGPLPVAVISDGVAPPAPRSLAWNDEPAPAGPAWNDEPASGGPVDVWSEGEAKQAPVDTSTSFDDDGPGLRTKPVKSGPPVLLFGVGIAAAMGVVGVVAALFLLSGGSPAPEARAFRPARAPTAVAAASTPAPAAEAPVALNVPAAAPAGAATSNPTPTVTAVSPAPVGAAARSALARERTARASTTTATATPRRARRSASSSAGDSALDEAPMAGPTPPSFDLGNALAPLMGGGAPVAQADDQVGNTEDDSSLASLGDRATAVGGQADSQPSVSAPPPMAPAPRPGDEVDWDVPFGG